MVFGLAAMAGGVATALPMGWLFGYGYGHGVRSGYHAFKPNEKVQSKHLSLNPLEGSHGAGMYSADEIMAQRNPKAGLATPDQVTPQVEQPSQGYWERTPHYESKDGRKITKAELNSIATKHNISPREAHRRFAKQEYPFNPKGYKQGRRR